jgi:hypothetical protein
MPQRRLFDREHDQRVRAAAFAWLQAQVAQHGDVLERAVLAEGFLLDGVRVPLVGPQGIFKPKVLEEAPLSITTTPEGPYNDELGSQDLLRYRYRGTDPEHPDTLPSTGCSWVSAPTTFWRSARTFWTRTTVLRSNTPSRGYTGRAFSCHAANS